MKQKPVRAVLILFAVLALAAVLFFLWRGREIGTMFGDDNEKILIGGELYLLVGTPGTSEPETGLARGRLLGTAVSEGKEKKQIYAAKGNERYVIADDGRQSALYERIETMPPALSTERSEP